MKEFLIHLGGGLATGLTALLCVYVLCFDKWPWEK